MYISSKLAIYDLDLHLLFLIHYGVISLLGTIYSRNGHNYQSEVNERFLKWYEKPIWNDLK